MFVSKSHLPPILPHCFLGYCLIIWPQIIFWQQLDLVDPPQKDPNVFGKLKKLTNKNNLPIAAFITPILLQGVITNSCASTLEEAKTSTQTWKGRNFQAGSHRWPGRALGRLILACNDLDNLLCTDMFMTIKFYKCGSTHPFSSFSSSMSHQSNAVTFFWKPLSRLRFLLFPCAKLTAMGWK